MTKDQKIAATRIVVDLIKADKVIDRREIEVYEDFKRRFGIGSDIETEAYGTTLAEAVNNLKNSGEKDKENKDVEKFLAFCRNLTVSDGFCSREEALLVMMLDLCLGHKNKADVISKAVDSVWFDDNQVLYVESDYDDKVNAVIESNLRAIGKEFNLCGLEFVYIPAVCEHYKKEYHTDADTEMVKHVAKLLIPTLSDRDVENLIENIKNLTTRNFCREQLYGKLGFAQMRYTRPALLLKIGQSRVRKNVVTNFLRIYVDKSVMETVATFCDNFMMLHSTDTMTVSLKRDEHGKFLYLGFYRQLFDLLTTPKQEPVILDLKLKGDSSIGLKDKEGESMGPRELALFLLIIFESRRGSNGAVFYWTGKKAVEQMENVRLKYKFIYERMPRAKEKTPDITDEKNRNSVISKIRKTLNELASKYDVGSIDSFKPIVEKGVYVVLEPMNKFRVNHYKESDWVSLDKSHLYKEFMEKFEQKS